MANGNIDDARTGRPRLLRGDDSPQDGLYIGDAGWTAIQFIFHVEH